MENEPGMERLNREGSELRFIENLSKNLGCRTKDSIASLILLTPGISESSWEMIVQNEDFEDDLFLS